MAKRTLEKLTVKELADLPPGRHSDGGGLYLQREETRSRWVFMYTPPNGKRREMGLGREGVGGRSIAKARKDAQQARDDIADGLDPIEARDARLRENLAKPPPTFGEVADDFLKAQESQWRNAKHIAQWKMTLKNYCAPIRATRVDLVDTEAVLSVLKPVWEAKPETASRLRGRIERILDAAKALDHRSGENPARWRGHLDHLLAKRPKLSRGHHAATSFDALPDFIADLQSRDAIAARALEFLILTAARSGEVMGARWSEIDLEAKVWTVPESRMKAGREHRVPLSVRAVEILTEIKPSMAVGEDPVVFRGGARGGGLSSMAMAMLLRRMKVKTTVHGFRSSFRDWAGEVSTFPREVAEAALAHTVGDQTERAYRRGDALEKRRLMMDAWATWCEPKAKDSNNVKPFRKPA